MVPPLRLPRPHRPRRLARRDAAGLLARGALHAFLLAAAFAAPLGIVFPRRKWGMCLGAAIDARLERQQDSTSLAAIRHRVGATDAALARTFADSAWISEDPEVFEFACAQASPRLRAVGMQLRKDSTNPKPWAMVLVGFTLIVVGVRIHAPVEIALGNVCYEDGTTIRVTGPEVVVGELVRKHGAALVAILHTPRVEYSLVIAARAPMQPAA